MWKMTRQLSLTVIAVGALASGRLARAEKCSAPAVPGFAVNSLTANNMTCPAASEALLTRLRNGQRAGWTCSERASGRAVALSCASAADKAKTYEAHYMVK